MGGRVEIATPESLAGGLVDRIAAAPGAARPGATDVPAPRIIGVDGWSGSGKTHLADRLAPALGAPCVHLDDLVPGWHGLAASLDLLVEWVLAPLAEGRPARWRHWDWSEDGWGRSDTLDPTHIVVVEGCGAGAPTVRPWLSGLVWLDADDDRRARRLLDRPDWAIYQPWSEVWREQEVALRDGDDPAGAADVVVHVDAGGTSALHLVWRRPPLAPG